MTGKNEDMVSHRLDALEDDVSEVKTAIKSIADSLRTLAALEAHHAETRDGLGRAFTAIDDHEKRLRAIEQNLPVLKLTSGWVQKIGWLVVSAVVGGLLLLVVKK